MLRDVDGVARDAPLWERIDLREPRARQALEDALAGLAAAPGSASLFHDPAWLLEAEDRTPDSVQAYVWRANGGVSAYAPFVVQPWRLRFRVGELTLFSQPFERLHVNGEPIVGASCDAETAIAALLASLRSTLNPAQALYFEGVGVGSAMERAVRRDSTRAAWQVVEPAPPYERCLIRLPDSFDAYMGALKSQTRQNLRNGRRRLEKHLGGALRLVRCTNVEDVPDFVRRAAAVSRKTYQWHLLGLGLRDPDALERTLAAMAVHGWTRCYLLECNGVATAFMLGYLYRGTYYYVDVGFDPDWEEWSVGTVLHLDVLRDLMEGDPRAQAFDFSSGSGVHKKRFSNATRLETSYLLVPRTARNRALLAAYRATDALSGAAVRALERLHLKAALKRLVRRRAAARADVE
jgi:CelD/BcsL family acetyltransferase involved in cellulose biosynthesis